MPHKLLLLAVFLLSIPLGGCRNKLATPLTAEEITALTRGEPVIFTVDDGNLGLEGLDGFYLGQDHQAAMTRLHEVCEVIETFDGGWRHNDAVFKGCIIDTEEITTTLRVGFWPQNGNRVSTLEIKERPLDQRVVRARFSELAAPLTLDLPRKGLLMMANTRYRLFASWDDGLDGPAHLTIGFQPK